jgi:hypothetical protein
MDNQLFCAEAGHVDLITSIDLVEDSLDILEEFARSRPFPSS